MFLPSIRCNGSLHLSAHLSILGPCFSWSIKRTGNPSKSAPPTSCFGRRSLSTPFLNPQTPSPRRTFHPQVTQKQGEIDARQITATARRANARTSYLELLQVSDALRNGTRSPPATNRHVRESRPLAIGSTTNWPGSFHSIHWSPAASTLEGESYWYSGVLDLENQSSRNSASRGRESFAASLCPQQIRWSQSGSCLVLQRENSLDCLVFWLG